MTNTNATLALLLPPDCFDLMRRVETLRLSFPPQIAIGESDSMFRGRYRREAEALAQAEAKLATAVLQSAGLRGDENETRR